jgi:hypothetical protein
MAQLMKAEARKGRQIADEMSETVTWLFLKNDAIDHENR